MRYHQQMKVRQTLNEIILIAEDLESMDEADEGMYSGTYYADEEINRLKRLVNVKELKFMASESISDIKYDQLVQENLDLHDENYELVKDIMALEDELGEWKLKSSTVEDEEEVYGWSEPEGFDRVSSIWSLFEVGDTVYDTVSQKEGKVIETGVKKPGGAYDDYCRIQVEGVLGQETELTVPTQDLVLLAIADDGLDF